MRAIDQLKTEGWIALDVEHDDDALIRLATEIGTPLRFHGSLIRRLRPIGSIDAPKGTFARIYGPNRYPLHSDTAFWPTPARYLVLSVTGDLRRKTHLLPWKMVLQFLGRDFLRSLEASIWTIPVTRGSFLATMQFRENGHTGYRFDPLSMLPTNSAARDVRLAMSELLSSVEPISFDWSRRPVLIVDNWLLLHGRGEAPVAESDRVLSRIYVK